MHVPNPTRSTIAAAAAALALAMLAASRARQLAPRQTVGDAKGRARNSHRRRIWKSERVSAQDTLDVHQSARSDVSPSPSPRPHASLSVHTTGSQFSMVSSAQYSPSPSSPDFPSYPSSVSSVYRLYELPSPPSHVPSIAFSDVSSRKSSKSSQSSQSLQTVYEDQEYVSFLDMA